jgi:hypothetical protein
MGLKVQANYTGSNGRSLTAVGTLMYFVGTLQVCMQVPSGFASFDVSACNSCAASTSAPVDPH